MKCKEFLIEYLHSCPLISKALFQEALAAESGKPPEQNRQGSVQPDEAHRLLFFSQFRSQEIRAGISPSSYLVKSNWFEDLGQFLGICLGNIIRSQSMIP